MSAVCPSCQVALVPGYVRCPKCHAALAAPRSKRSTNDPGGTALEDRAFPTVPVLGAVAVAAVVIAVFAFGGSGASARKAPAIDPLTATPSRPGDDQSTLGATAPQPSRVVPTQPAPSPVVAGPAAPDPVAAIERALRRERLWATVQVAAPRVDVRSASCRDAALASAIDGIRSALREAGLTRLRCVEQSGAVVFERDL